MEQTGKNPKQARIERQGAEEGRFSSAGRTTDLQLGALRQKDELDHVLKDMASTGEMPFFGPRAALAQLVEQPPCKR